MSSSQDDTQSPAVNAPLPRDDGKDTASAGTAEYGPSAI